MSKKLSGKGLVIQLSSGQIRIIKTTLGAAMPPILASFTADLPERAVEDGVIHNLDAVREILQAALASPEFRRVKRVIFSLCTTQVIAEDTSFPPVPLNKVDKMLEANKDMYFPVDTQNYHLTWQVVDKQTKKGDMLVQMWAVPTAIVRPYYALANSCGLSVVAIDYCGHALASAVGSSFCVPAEKKTALKLSKHKKDEESEQSAVAVAEAEPVSDTELYLMAEPEHLQMLFVHDGHIKLQRMSLCRAGAESELSEVLMALDYYDSMNIGRYGKVNCTLCGSLALDEEFVALTQDILSIPVRVLPGLNSPEWALCLGAAQTDMDFGVPSLNRPGGIKEINNAWQYGLVLVGGVALALSLVATFGSKTIWSTTLSGLESSKQTLQIQAAQNSNYAKNYYEYQSNYQNYSGDWEALFGSLRTYNDNLVLMFDELEDTLPKETSVVGIQIADTGLALELATPTKEQAAYTIMALRKLQYADLMSISDLAKPVYEAPPVVGGTADSFLDKALESGLITEDMLIEILTSDALSEEALNDLVNGNISERLVLDILNSGIITEETIKKMVEDKMITEDMILDLVESGVITEDMVMDLVESGAITDEMIQSLVESGLITDELIQDFVDSGVISQNTLKDLVDNGTVSKELLDKMVEKGVLTKEQLNMLLGNGGGSGSGGSGSGGSSSGSGSGGSSSGSGSGSSNSGSSNSGNSGSGNSGSGSSNSRPSSALKNYLDSVSDESFIASLFKLTPEQMDILEDAYAPVPKNTRTLDDLLSRASLEERQVAFKTLLTKDPIGMYRFFNLFQIDMERPTYEAVLHPKVYIGFWDNIDMFLPLLGGTATSTTDASNALAGIVIKDEDCLSSAEKLVREDKRLEARYAYYLAVSIGLMDAPKNPVLDPNVILSDIVSGKYPEGSDKDALEKIFEILFPGLRDIVDASKEAPDVGELDIPTVPGINTNKLWEQIFGDLGLGGSGSTGSLGGLGGLGDLSGLFPSIPGNSQNPTQSVDERYHFTVILGYKDTLIAAERERKGLDYAAKIAELEVAE